jgi:alkylated DNA repair dioxygenase AlkB
VTAMPKTGDPVGDASEELWPLSGGGLVRWVPRFLTPVEADEAFRRIGETTPWKQEHLTLFGRSIAQPRLTAWMGDPEAVYTYSGLTLIPIDWTPPVRMLRTKVEEATGERFNGVLLNLYRDGNDSMGLHADDEPELGPVVASVSLGAARRFVLKPRGKHRREVSRSLPLAHGSLLVMDAATQSHWVHGIPKQPGIREARINLTFRSIVRSGLSCPPARSGVSSGA